MYRSYGVDGTGGASGKLSEQNRTEHESKGEGPEEVISLIEAHTAYLKAANHGSAAQRHPSLARATTHYLHADMWHDGISRHPVERPAGVGPSFPSGFRCLIGSPVPFSSSSLHETNNTKLGVGLFAGPLNRYGGKRVHDRQCKSGT